MSKRPQGESNSQDSYKKIKMNNVNEETFINYCPVPALENIIAVSAIKEQWKMVNYEQRMGNQLDKTQRYEVIQNWKSEIWEKVSQYPLPGPLLSKVLEMINPLGFQINNWLEYIRTYSFYHISSDQFKCIRWTDNGIINKVETFSLMIEKNFTGKKDTDAFEMACRMCSENLIRMLWNNISSYKREYLGQYSTDVFVVFWSHFMNDDMEGLLDVILSGNYNIIINHNVYQSLFVYSLEESNLEAVKYFWDKLTEEEKADNIETWISNALKNKELWYNSDDDLFDFDGGGEHPDEDDDEEYNDVEYSDDEEYDERKQQLTNEFFDIIFFLLSKINNDLHQTDIIWEFKSTILDALFSFWPWQKFLMPTVQLLWDFANDDQEYTDILFPLLSNLRKGSFRKKLFMELFAVIPLNFKNSQLQIFLDGNGEVLSIYPTVFKEALKDNDISTFETLLNDFTDEKKRRVIDSRFFRDSIIPLIYRDINKIREIDDLLRKTIVSRRDIKHFKVKLVEEHDICITHNWLCTGNRVAIDTFIHWIFISEKNIKTFKLRHAKKVITEFKGHFEFRKFLEWCFDSEKEVYDFKIYVTRYKKLKSIVTTIIGKHHNFTFAFDFLNWCLERKDIKDFKERLFLSSDGMKLFEAFLFSAPYPAAQRSTRYLSEWYGPMKKYVIARFRDRVKRIKKRIFHQRKYKPFSSNIVRKRKKLYDLLVQFVLHMERYDLVDETVDSNSEGSVSSSDVLDSDGPD